MLSAKDFGAAGDGQTDDTPALQQALNAAAGQCQTVYLPAGVYRCGSLRLPSFTGLCAEPTWSYRKPGGAVLQLADSDLPCLLELNNVQGVTLSGLCLDGGRLGHCVHGVMLHNQQQGWPRESENAVRLERCRIDHFTGDGIHLDKAWAFSIRHCMISHNAGHGVRLAGCDGFFLDNWISGNGGCGFATCSWNGSCTFTANRIEWNRGSGIHIRGGFAYQLTGNYIDRSGGPAILLEPWLPERPYNEHFSITSNIIYRSGKHATLDSPPEHNCQVALTSVRGLSFVGNTLMIGQDDKHHGTFTPRFGLVLRDLDQTVITANNLCRGAIEQLIVDQGGHGSECIIRDNPGSLAR